MTRRHVVIVAPPWYPTPPDGYGGIELVVGLLADALRDEGHRVTLLGGEGSQPGTIVLAPRSWGTDLGGDAERLRELTYASRVARTLLELDNVDVVHDHCGFSTLLAAHLTGVAPVVHTVHGDIIPEPYATFYAGVAPRIGLVAISSSQRGSVPGLPWAGTVHNAVDMDSLIPTPAEKEPYLLCLARICPDKGQHVAVEVARRARMRLVLAGKVEETAEAMEYYERRVAPAIDGERVVHVQNAAGAEKSRLLSRAHGLLAPLQWEEPFGLSMVEAMASGTPVLAFARGAAPELVTDGVTGFLVRDEDEMVGAVPKVADIDPLACAAASRARFSPEAMARAYLRIYDDIRLDPLPPDAPPVVEVTGGRASAATT